jgi:hypothetical protein
MATKEKAWLKSWPPRWAPKGWDPFPDDWIEPVSKIIVKNNTKKNIYVSIDKTGGFGDDDWFRIAPGEKETWRRLYHRHVRIRVKHSKRDSAPELFDDKFYTNFHSKVLDWDIDGDGDYDLS